MWDNQIGYLSADLRVIRYDVRGFGRSSRISENYSDYKDLLALLDHLKIDRAILVGASNGGRISLDFAVEYPERVRGLVLVDSGIKGFESSGPDEDKLWVRVTEQEAEYLRLRRDGKFREAASIDVDLWTSEVSPDLRKQLIEIAEYNIHSDSDDPFNFQVSPDPPAYKRLGALKMPILIIAGDRDVPGMINLSESIHKELPQSRLIIIRGADHIPSLSKPEEFRREVSAFLKELT